MLFVRMIAMAMAGFKGIFVVKCYGNGAERDVLNFRLLSTPSALGDRE